MTAAPEPVAAPGSIRGAWAVLRLAAGQAREHRVPMIAQALAYSLFLAIPASLLVLLGIFSLVSDPSDVGQLVDRLESVMPAEAAEAAARGESVLDLGGAKKEVTVVFADVVAFTGFAESTSPERGARA